MRIENIEARFIGRDGSCGFSTGRIYQLWKFFDNKNRICISRRNLNATSIPYDTQNAFEKNWEIVMDSNKQQKTSDQLDGFISKITFPNGKTYGLQCYVVAVHPIKCPNCGHSFELAYGKGKCEFCGTYFTTQFQIVEDTQPLVSSELNDTKELAP